MEDYSTVENSVEMPTENFTESQPCVSEEPLEQLEEEQLSYENSEDEQPVAEESVEESVEESLPEVVEESLPEVVEESLPEVVEESVQEESLQEVVEESVQEEPVQEVVEEPVQEVVEEPVQEVVEESVEESVQEVVEESVEEPVQEVVEEPVQQESLPEVVEEPVQEVVEEPVQQESVEESVQEVVEESVEESVQEVVEEPVQQESVEESVQEVVEEPVQQESLPEVVEEPVQQESVPEVVEEPFQQESLPEVIEELQEEPVESVPELTEELQQDESENMPTENISYQIETEDVKDNSVPSLVFIVPYRDREQQQQFFANQMSIVMQDYEPNAYRIIYVHQNDTRSFNRGAMKNIGFLYVKQQYPNDYKNITLVFNDVDTMPLTKGFLNYATVPGKVKHFYGYKFTLGGIVSINAADFELVNGFPNYWAWGYEDNAFQLRVLLGKLIIDRRQFYPIMDKNMIQLKDGIQRLVNRQEFDKYVNEVTYKNNKDGIKTISNINFDFENANQFLHVNQFNTLIPENPALNQSYDMRNGPIPFKMSRNQQAGRRLINMGGLR